MSTPELWTEPKEVPKAPGEAFNISVDFTQFLPAGVTISAAGVSSVNKSTGASSTSEVTEGAQISGSKIKVWVKAGTAGDIHQIKTQATGNGGEVLILNTDLRIKAD